jgi:hypothetical protein
MERSLKSIAKKPMFGKVKKPNAWKTQMTNYRVACTLVLTPWNWTKKGCFWMWFVFSMNTMLNMAKKA